MKKILVALSFALFLSPLAKAAEDIVVGVTPFPHKDIMEVVKPLMKEKGYNLIIREFTDYVQPNMALAQKQLFANFFQHLPYLENTNHEAGYNLSWIAKVHIEPLGLYSRKITSLDQLADGSRLAVPNDPTNEARALRLLETHGLIRLKAGDLVTVRDIIANPRNLDIRELDAAQLPRTLDDVVASVINTNFAGEAGLVPATDAIIIEGKESPYANVVVVREADEDSPAALALRDASNSPEVRKFIEDVLMPKGIVPAF
jgi:ABC-type metal ion transport system, periplasmic component/surface antigen